MTTAAAPRHDVETFVSLTLDDTTRDRLQAELMAVQHPERNADASSPLLFKAFAQLPTAQLEQLLDFGRHPDMPGVGLVRNLPVDPELPPTPADGGPSDEKATSVSEGNLLGLSLLLGEPTGAQTEKAGQLVHDVIPVADGARTQTNKGSAVFLNFHNDIVYDPSGVYTMSNPDFLVLHCVRSDPEGEAKTYYADARDIARALSDEEREVVSQPVFHLNAPGSYCRNVAKAEEVLSEPVPLISGPEHMPEIGISANGVRGMTTAAEQAITGLQRACREVAHVVHLRPGDALLVNNRKGVHARSQFTARHDGTDRWLQRSYVRRTTWAVRNRLANGHRRMFS